MTTSLTVVKLGGRAQAECADAVARLWRERPFGLVLVHGGGDEVSALQRVLGATPQFVGGRRVTTAGDIDVIRMALSGVTNKQLVAAFGAAGLRAIGLSGEDGGLIVADPSADAAMGLVGTPATVNTTLLGLLLDAGYLPVISPLAASSAGTGQALNVNGDDAAAAIAVALGAAELFFMADVPGVLVDGAPVASLDPDGAVALAGPAGASTASMSTGVSEDREMAIRLRSA